MKLKSSRSCAVSQNGLNSSSAPMEPVPRDGDLQLSFAQQRLWFLHQLEPESAAYNVHVVIRVAGRLNVAVLEQSLREIIRRHETLRTTFGMVMGRPIQIIASTFVVKIPVVDLRTWSKADREVQIQQLATEEIKRAFDLEKGPLFRSILLRLDREEHVLILTMHHIISDGWSRGVLVRELMALYQAFCAGKPSPLTELPIQYADFSVWQRKWLQKHALKEQFNYWRQQLKGVPSLELPTDRPRPPVQTYHGARHSKMLPKQLAKALKALSKREGMTLFMTLLAAFQTLLYRYTGQENIVVGTPIANRNRTEIEGLIGFFVNTLVLNTALTGNPTFFELLGRVREVALGAYAHQDLPFEMLVEKLHPERDLSHNPLFQVLFVLQNTSRDTLELSGVTLSELTFDYTTVRFDLEFHLFEKSEEELSCEIIYNTDLFDAETIVRLVAHYHNLLKAIVANPEQRLSDLLLLTEVERHKMMVEWNNTYVDYSSDKCIHHLFEDQVEKTPDALAIAFENEQLSYAELNTRANQLARILRKKGVSPGDVVGMLIERSLEVIVGILGILKAGGAYLPIDNHYPEERIFSILNDSQISLLLTNVLLPNRKTGDGKLEVLLLDRINEKMICQDTGNPESMNEASDLACIIYTSGSTGKPKGVSLPHRAITNMIHWHHQMLMPSRKTLQFASLSFDVSFHEIFATLLCGGTLMFLPEETRLEVSRLSYYIRDQQIEKAILPLVMLHQLAVEYTRWPSLPATLKEISSTGEQLQINEAVRELFFRLPQCVLHNIYGPTEYQVVTANTMKGDPSAWEVYPPIGEPISNTRVYILDRYLNPVPLGIPGELWVTGAGQAQGYLNNAKQTAEKFIPNPFAKQPGERLYKTGDRTRWLTNGKMEYMGRLDQQVKIRGFRVEPSEVEAAIIDYPSIREAVVFAHENAPGNKQLVCYLVVEEGKTPPSIKELRSFLKRKLPDYMIPPVMMTLDELPLTSTGKIDRDSLPLPDRNRLLETPFVAPRTPTEKAIAQIWSDVLEIERIGIHDNFFEIGGHSLLATQVISRLRDNFQVDLPVRLLFDQQTVAGLAEVFDAYSLIENDKQSFSSGSDDEREEIEI